MGGGDTTVQQAPTTPAPSASESAEGIYQARLKYDPLVAAQEFATQQEYMPKQASLYSSLYSQYLPEYSKAQQKTQQELYPYQSQIVEQGAQRALERLQNPEYMTASEQSAQQSIRDRSISDLQKAMRERANLGGNLYGGRTAAAETQSVSDLLNQFQVQDYQNRMTNSYNAQAALTPYMQILYPQVGTQQPNISGYQYQSAVPSADTLYNAMFQASQPELYSTTSPDRMGQLMQLGGTAAMARALSR